MLYTVGRLLQFLGLLILPLAIAGNLANERLTLVQSLQLSGVGILIFSLVGCCNKRPGDVNIIPVGV